MRDIYYWTLCRAGLRPFSRTKYFAFVSAGEDYPTNPAYALRWKDLEDAEQFRNSLSGIWTPKLIRFEGSALCGGKKHPRS